MVRQGRDRPRLVVGAVKYGDYDKLPDLRPGEPFFFLRAQDLLAPASVQHYAQLLRIAAAGAMHGCREEGEARSLEGEFLGQAEEVEAIAARMVVWQVENGTKLPD